VNGRRKTRGDRRRVLCERGDVARAALGGGQLICNRRKSEACRTPAQAMKHLWELGRIEVFQTLERRGELRTEGKQPLLAEKRNQFADALPIDVRHRNLPK